MRTVSIQWPDLEIAFERNSPDIDSYLDLQNGEVVSISTGEPDADEKRDRVADAPEDFVRIDSASSREQYQWMEKFVTSVEDEALRARLIISIDGKGAFRRFKDVLLNYPAERERWFTYRGGLLHYHMQQWLEQREITALNAPPWGTVEVPLEPTAVVGKPALAHGEAPGEFLRRQAREILDAIPAVELPSAIAFLDFLRERGLAALLANGKRPKAKLPAPPAQVAAARAKAAAGAKAAFAASPERPSTTESPAVPLEPSERSPEP